MYRDQEKTMSAGKSTLGGVLKPIATMPLQGVLQEALFALHEAKQNVDITDAKLFGAKQNVDITDAKLFGARVCDVAEACAPDSPNEPIDVLVYKIRDLVQGLVKATASIETRL